MKLNKKGQVFQQLGALAVGVVTVGIVLVIGFLIISQGRAQIVTIDDVNVSDTSTMTNSYNATITMANAMDDIPDWVPLIIIASIGAILLGLVALFRRSAR